MNRIILYITILLSAARANAQLDIKGNVFYSFEENLSLYLEPITDTERIYTFLRVIEETENSKTEILYVQLDTSEFANTSYTIADNFQINTKKILLIKNSRKFYIYDLRKPELLGPFKPIFWGIYENSESGNITNIKISEAGNCVFGNTKNNGSFVFNICDLNNIYEITSANMPFLTEGKFFEIPDCQNQSFSGYYIIEEYNRIISKQLFTNKKIIPTDNSSLKNLTADEIEEIVMNTNITESRYTIVEEINSENLQKYTVIDIFTGNIIELPADKKFPDKKSIYKYLQN